MTLDLAPFIAERRSIVFQRFRRLLGLDKPLAIHRELWECYLELRGTGHGAVLRGRRRE